MKLYFKSDGSVDTSKPNEAQIFAHSSNSDTLYVFSNIYWDVEGVRAYADFKLPIKNAQGEWTGTYDAKSLQLAKATLEGVNCWKATIPAQYLANSGRAYVSLSFHYGVAPDTIIKTTQKVPFEVQASELVIINPLLLEESDMLNSRLTEVEGDIVTLNANKQDKEDNLLATQSKQVVGAINEVNAKEGQTSASLGLTNQNLAQVQSDVEYLKQHQARTEDYIGQMNVGILPTDQELNAFVESVKGRTPMNADVIIVVEQITTETDKIYKYTYTGTGWGHYQIPPIEQASNDNFGSIKGTYLIGADRPLVINITGGIISNIYVKDTETNGYRDIVEFAQTTKQNIADILSGALSVASANESLKDALGNIIHSTYLTLNAGATKQFVRDYALPKIFNEILFISANGFTPLTPTTPASGIQFTKTIANIGETNLFELTHEVNTETEISKKNSINTTLHIGANVDCEVQLKITASIKHPDNEYVDAVVEILDAMSFQAGEIKKIQTNEYFLGLGENVFQTITGDIARLKLDIICTDSTSKTFNVYSNATYPSNISINVATQSIVVSQGALGEQPVVEAIGTFVSIGQQYQGIFNIHENNVFTDTTEIMLVLKVANDDYPKLSNAILGIKQGEETIDAYVPTASGEGHGQAIFTFDTLLKECLYYSEGEYHNFVFKPFIRTTNGLSFYFTMANFKSMLVDKNILCESKNKKLDVVLGEIQDSIPTKTSQLANDSNFVVANQLPTKTSDLINDSGFVTEEDVPTKTSQLTNDSNFATRSELPTKTSDLTNDSGFVNENTSALTNYEVKTNVGTSIAMTLDSTNYKLKLDLKNSAGSVLSTQTIDFPIESMVVSARYDSTNKAIILTLQSGSQVSFSVADLVSGLVPDTRTVNGKALSTNITLTKSDIGLGNVDNTSDANKPVSSATQTALNLKQDKMPNTGTGFKGIHVENGVVTFGDISGVDNPLYINTNWNIYANGTLLQFRYGTTVVFEINYALSSSSRYVDLK